MMPRTTRIPPRDAITDETMMPLSVAAEVAVAHGVVSSATMKALKREADRGRLAVYAVFGRLHTTLGDIKTMIRASSVQPKAPISAEVRATGDGAPPTPATINASRTAALAAAQRLKERCKRRSG